MTLMNEIWTFSETYIKMLGQLPSGYNKAVHGPYDPAVFYGKADIPLSQVKWEIVWFVRN